MINLKAYIEENRSYLGESLIVLEQLTDAQLRSYRSNLERDSVNREIEYETLVQHFANELRHTNLNFDRARFIAACMAV